MLTWKTSRILLAALSLLLTGALLWTPAIRAGERKPDPEIARVAKKLPGRWELPGGKEPMVFAPDGKCEVHFGTGMIKGTYTIGEDGKITVEAKTKDIRLTEDFRFEGERLTDGAVFFETGKQYWKKVRK